MLQRVTWDKPRKRFCFSSENVPVDTRRSRGPGTVPLSPAQEFGIIRMQRGSVQWQTSPWGDQSLGRIMSSTITQGTPTTLQKNQHLQLRAIQRAPGKISFPGKISVNHCGSDSTPWRFCTCRITPAWKSHNFGACMVPPEIPAGKLLQETFREPELSPRQWGWLGNGCDFYSPKFDRLPRFVLFVFLRETFYGTQKYFANENKKATYRRLCEPPHRQMLLNTVFNWD